MHLFIFFLQAIKNAEIHCSKERHIISFLLQTHENINISGVLNEYTKDTIESKATHYIVLSYINVNYKSIKECFYFLTHKKINSILQYIFTRLNETNYKSCIAIHKILTYTHINSKPCFFFYLRFQQGHLVSSVTLLLAKHGKEENLKRKHQSYIDKNKIWLGRKQKYQILFI